MNLTLYPRVYVLVYKQWILIKFLMENDKSCLNITVEHLMDINTQEKEKGVK